jgi:hypothetical protein
MVLPVILALLPIVGVLLLCRNLRNPRRLVTRSVWCPLTDRGRQVTLQESTWDGQRLDVTACSAFTPPTAIGCGKACLRITRRPRPHRVPAIPPLL